MKEPSTSLLRSLKIYILGILGALLLRLIHLTIRWEWAGATTPEQLNSLGHGKVIAFWHARQLMMSFSYRGRGGKPLGKGVYALISQHSDGRLIALAVKLLGIHSVAGSSTRGGKEASKELIKKLREGFDVAITPDGPKGPRCEAKNGVVVLAKDGAVPIFPMTYSAERYWRFNSWDKMIFPKPFTRGVFFIGEPVLVSADADAATLEARREDIKQKLIAADLAADSYFAQRAQAYV